MGGLVGALILAMLGGGALGWWGADTHHFVVAFVLSLVWGGVCGLIGAIVDSPA